MDSNSSLILINLVINLLVVVDHFINRLKSSKCWGSELQFNDNKNNDLEQNKILEQLKILTNLKQLDEKSNDNKKDDPINKL